MAEAALAEGEVPVGAVLVLNGQELVTGWNQPISSHDPTAHAEIVALRAAGALIGNYRLLNTTLYVTLEPCIMCMAALVNARVQRVVFGATDPKRGGAVSVARLGDTDYLNHRIQVEGGILEEQCRTLLHNFFKQRR